MSRIAKTVADESERIPTDDNVASSEIFSTPASLAARPKRDALDSDSTLLNRLGIPSTLAWGFVGLLLFMIGDGIESGYLSPYMVQHGLSQVQTAWVFSAYGMAVAVAGWFAGVLADIYGPRRVVFAGLLLWLSFETLFLAVGLRSASFPVILVTYGLRGFGYPLFAFGFLVWINMATPPQRLSSAMGWFWFAFTGGLPTLGSAVASIAVPRLGAYVTFWISMIFVGIGGLALLLGVREQGGRPIAGSALVASPLRAFYDAVALIWRKPQVGFALIVRVINTTPQFGFFVFLPAFFIDTVGFSMAGWLQLLSAIFFSNILWNLLFGFIGNNLGWRRTIAWCGGFGCTLTTLGLYYLPRLHHSYPLSILAGVLYGATLAGYVPLSALMPSLAPDHKGSALSLMSLGAGMSVWVGPALVALLFHRIGVGGIMWVFAMLYLLSGLITLFLTGSDENDLSYEVS